MKHDVEPPTWGDIALMTLILLMFGFYIINHTHK